MSQIPNPGNPYQSANPYQQPTQQPPGGGGKPGAVVAPAIALIVVGVIDILHALFSVVVNALGTQGSQVTDEQRKQLEELGGVFKWLVDNPNQFGVIMGIVWLCLSLVVLFGGIQMLRLRGYPIAVIGAVVAIIPCTGIMSCCLVEEGIGIWALVVLMMADYKRLFR